MSDDSLQLDCLAVGAHPDDVEIACGGTLARLVDRGYRVGIVDLTDGEPTPASPGPHIRLAEAELAAKTLGVDTRITLPLPNRRLFDSFESRVALAKVFRTCRPRLVLGFGDKTPMASPDHWQAMQITDAAIFYSRLTKWDQHFDGLPTHTIEAQLYFTLALHGEPHVGGGQIVNDIGDTLERKLASIRCYETQFPPEKAYFMDRVESHARVIGQSAGFAAGELFINPRRFGTADLLGAVLR